MRACAESTEGLSSSHGPRAGGHFFAFDTRYVGRVWLVWRKQPTSRHHVAYGGPDSAALGVGARAARSQGTSRPSRGRTLEAGVLRECGAQPIGALGLCLARLSASASVGSGQLHGRDGAVCARRVRAMRCRVPQVRAVCARRVCAVCCLCRGEFFHEHAQFRLKMTRC